SGETTRYVQLRQRLIDEYPGLDDETLFDTLEGITDLHEMISAVNRSALVDEALQVGLRTRLDDMRQRLVRLAERGLKKRQLALEAMNEAGLKKLEQPDFTASARLGAPHLLVTSEQSIPEGYWVPQPPKLDRQTLTSDLRRGDQIPGACLGNAAPILTVRTK
ncbi:MAG: siphovirus Gp157 family protein, partial [Terriglobales bacterium]